MSNRYARFIAALAFAGAAAGQTRVDLKSQSKSVDFSAATSTKPFQTGASLPATCGIGQMYFLTLAVGGQNTYGCTATNTWSLQSSGAGGTLTIKNLNTIVGARPIIDFSAGQGSLLATSDTGQEISIQTSLDTSIVQTRADHQAGIVLFCKSTSAGAPGVAFVCALSPTLNSYTSGMVLHWTPDLTGIGGATTLNVDALGAIPIVKDDGVTAPGSSDIVRGRLYQLWYDGAVFRLPSSGGGSGGSSYALPTRYQTFSCQPGLGDGFNVITAGTYLQSECFNQFGATYTITGIWCFTDNAGSSTLTVTNGAGTALLTGPIACNSAFPGTAGAQTGATTIANGDGIKFTFVADGASKQTTWIIAGTR